ncbi:MAG: hypothetical protein EON88_23840, partial [Brevundimonas sp.]
RGDRRRSRLCGPAVGDGRDRLGPALLPGLCPRRRRRLHRLRGRIGDRGGPRAGRPDGERRAHLVHRRRRRAPRPPHCRAALAPG